MIAPADALGADTAAILTAAAGVGEAIEFGVDAVLSLDPPPPPQPDWLSVMPSNARARIIL